MFSCYFLYIIHSAIVSVSLSFQLFTPVFYGNISYYTINSSSSLEQRRGWDKSPSLSIVFGLSSKTQWLSGLYYADFISFYSPTQLCGGGTTKSNSNQLPISVPLSFSSIRKVDFFSSPTIVRQKSDRSQSSPFLARRKSPSDCFTKVNLYWSVVEDLKRIVMVVTIS